MLLNAKMKSCSGFGSPLDGNIHHFFDGFVCDSSSSRRWICGAVFLNSSAKMIYIVKSSEKSGNERIGSMREHQEVVGI